MSLQEIITIHRRILIDLQDELDRLRIVYLKERKWHQHGNGTTHSPFRWEKEFQGTTYSTHQLSTALNLQFRWDTQAEAGSQPGKKI